MPETKFTVVCRLVAEELERQELERQVKLTDDYAAETDDFLLHPDDTPVVINHIVNQR